MINVSVYTNHKVPKENQVDKAVSNLTGTTVYHSQTNATS